MRNYLKELNIVGGVGVWSEGEICRYSIENLISICDRVVIMMDNSDDKTKSIVMEYKNKYPDIVVVGENNILPAKEDESIMRRQKKYEGEIIQAAFDLIRKVHDERPIDILLFIDSDEMFTDNFPNILEDFVKRKEDTIFIRPIEVYGWMNVICNKGLVAHAKVYKYVKEISSIPYSKQNYYLPYRINRNIIKAPWNFVHLARLTEENRALRIKIRSRHSSPDNKLRRVNKPAYQLTPEEHEKVINHPDFIRLGDWDGEYESIPLIEL